MLVIVYISSTPRYLLSCGVYVFSSACSSFSHVSAVSGEGKKGIAMQASSIWRGRERDEVRARTKRIGSADAMQSNAMPFVLVSLGLFLVLLERPWSYEPIEILAIIVQLLGRSPIDPQIREQRQHPKCEELLFKDADELGHDEHSGGKVQPDDVFFSLLKFGAGEDIGLHRIANERKEGDRM